MATELQSMPLNFLHGISATHVVVQMSRPVDNFQLTPDQCDAFILNMTKMLNELRKRQGVKAN